MEDSLNLPNISRIFPPGTFLGLLASRGLSAAVFFRDIMKILGTYKIAVVLYIYIPYGSKYLLRKCLGYNVL